MKDKYIFIPADLSLPCTFIDIEDDDDCSRFNDRVHELISCDCYEAVYVYSDLIMLVDESGRLKDKPINYRASSFYRGTPYGNPIVGDVVVCSIDWVDTVMPDGKIIHARDFCPLGPVYSAILADCLNITSTEPV